MPRHLLSIFALGSALAACGQAAPVAVADAPTAEAHADAAVDAAAAAETVPDAAAAADAAEISDLPDAADAPPPADVLVDADVPMPAEISAAVDSATGPELAVDAGEIAQLDAIADTSLPDAPADAKAAEDLFVEAGPDSAKASDGSCFYGQPPADVSPTSLPMPATCDQVLPPDWFDGQPLPPPTLLVQAGQFDADQKQWLPYQNGGWVPLHVGSQGGFHIAVNPKVWLPGTQTATTKVQYKSFALFGCNEVATASVVAATLVQAPDPGDVYTTEPAKPLNTVFGMLAAVGLAPTCGQWLELYVRVRVPNSNVWGESHVMLRAFADSGPPQKP